jgi:hypothetical protein
MKKLVLFITTLAILAWSSSAIADEANNPDFILVYDYGYYVHTVVVVIGPNGEIVPWE